MTQEKRFGISAAQKSDVWCHWKAGDSLHKIGRTFGKEDQTQSEIKKHYSGPVEFANDFDCFPVK